MVFQEFGLLPWRTVQANVELGLELKGMAAQERREVSQPLIEMVGLAGFESALSARAVRRHEAARRPRPRARHRSQRAADGRAVRGARRADPRPHAGRAAAHLAGDAKKTVLFVTHQIDEAIYLSDRVMVMTKRPGRAKKIFTIDLPRPRDYEMRVTPRVQRAQARDLERAQGRDHGVADGGHRRRDPGPARELPRTSIARCCSACLPSRCSSPPGRRRSCSCRSTRCSSPSRT